MEHEAVYSKMREAVDMVNEARRAEEAMAVRKTVQKVAPTPVVEDDTALLWEMLGDPKDWLTAAAFLPILAILAILSATLQGG